ncbi:NAD(P)-dependent dehydrogenase, short-chain alcohol dehydrogenase family [Chitinophaga rupis]|uniref:NAD(P)-dependent dehydrogenase, short-chain alcohol dehydrogenase family n=1 Tax=Chitinophaga rupis TaxID=573321 RepID=A0A1H8B012_9BACT|nr:SDR family oxidoreductase [Chitinophaga rupis]SEM76320.1 NAD(P)-dependent dehydrogenase, short-chain alcohol dehydrogenase family [Chitinophaga rupis]
MENQSKQGSALAGKRVILLGGSSGFGLATAKAAAAEGAKVVIVSSNQQRVDQALQQLPAGSEGYAIDLSKEANIKDFFEKAGAFDHLVYTAAENISLNNLSETVIDNARQFFGLRYWSALAAVKYGAPHINPGGSICLTGGIAGLRPGKGWTIAASICGAMEGLTRALAVELAPIRVNSVVPGVVRTNLWNSLPEADREGLYKNVGDALLVKRVGEAEEIALAFLYLMKQQFGTGQNMVIDGGASLI